MSAVGNEILRKQTPVLNPKWEFFLLQQRSNYMGCFILSHSGIRSKHYTKEKQNLKRVKAIIVLLCRVGRYVYWRELLWLLLAALPIKYRRYDYITL